MHSLLTGMKRRLHDIAYLAAGRSRLRLNGSLWQAGWPRKATAHQRLPSGKQHTAAHVGLHMPARKRRRSPGQLQQERRSRTKRGDADLLYSTWLHTAVSPLASPSWPLRLGSRIAQLEMVHAVHG